MLADALAREADREVVLATRRTHELQAMPHAHEVLGLWADAPRGPRSTVRTARVAMGRALGWCRLVRAVRPGDVVHLQAADRPAELPFVWLLRLRGVVLLLTAHNAEPHDTRRPARWMAGLLYRSVRCVVTHTDELGAAVRAAAGRPIPVVVVRHPTYAPIADAFGTAPHPTGAAPLRVAHLGTIRPYKGFEHVVEAVESAQAVWPDLTFEVMGKPTDDGEVRALIASLRAGSTCATLEHVPIDRLVDAARRADVVVLGHRSSSESGIALLALGAGAVVVGPNVSAIGRLLAGEPSWAYEPGEAAEVLQRVLAEVEADRAGMRQRARALADSAPSWRAMARRTLDYVDALR